MLDLLRRLGDLCAVSKLDWPGYREVKCKAWKVPSSIDRSALQPSPRAEPQLSADSDLSAADGYFNLYAYHHDSDM